MTDVKVSAWTHANIISYIEDVVNIIQWVHNPNKVGDDSLVDSDIRCVVGSNRRETGRRGRDSGSTIDADPVVDNCSGGHTSIDSGREGSEDQITSTSPGDGGYVRVSWSKYKVLFPNAEI